MDTQGEETRVGPGRRSPGRWLGPALAVLVLVAAALVSWALSRQPAPSAEAGHVHEAGASSDERGSVMVDAATAARIGVTYATAERGGFTEERRAVGIVVADEARLHVFAPKVDGWVERLWVNTTGQLVRAGDPVLSVYSPQLVSAQEELLLARRLATEAPGADSDALLRAAERRLRFWDISERELTEIVAERAARRALTLYAPVQGFVLEKRVVAGQRIMPGDALLRIADLSSVWVEGEFFEQDAALVRVGAGVELRFEALGNERRRARIAYVYPTVDEASRTLRARVVLPNADLRLKPGMFASLSLQASVRDAIVIPRSAVLSTGTRDLVFVRMSDGTLMPHDVRVGRRSATMAEILDGIAAGDVVVSSATFLVDAESNLRAALGAMAGMPGMSTPTGAAAPDDNHGEH